MGWSSSPRGYGGPFPLRASVDGRSFVTANNQPYLIMGEGSAQFLFQRLPTDVEYYLQNRAAAGFNAIWCHVFSNQQNGANNNALTDDGIAPFTGTNSGNTVDGGSDWDLTTPNPAYFNRMDQIIRIARDCNMAVFLDSWDNDSALHVFENNGDTKVSAYATYIANRYRNFDNVVLMVGNDFQTWNSSATDNQLGADQLAAFANDPSKLRTVQLNFNMSGASDNSLLYPYVTAASAYTYFPNYYQVQKEYNAGTKPTYLIESYYEGMTFGNLTPTTATNAMLRRIPWWTITSGGLGGYFYGSIWVNWGGGWQTGINTTAVTQLGYWKSFFISIPWYLFVPDQTNSVLTAGFGTATGNNAGRIDTDTYATCSRVPDGSLVVVYNPAGNTLTIDMTKLRGTVTARWFDPSNGTYTAIGSFANTGTHNFATPGNNSAGDPDWALRLDA